MIERSIKNGTIIVISFIFIVLGSPKDKEMVQNYSHQLEKAENEVHLDLRKILVSVVRYADDYCISNPSANFILV